MSMAEILPALMGFVLGVLLGNLRPSYQRWGFLPSVALLGASATIASGEFRISWDFLYADIPLAAIATLAGLAARKALSAARCSRMMDLGVLTLSECLDDQSEGERREKEPAQSLAVADDLCLPPSPIENCRSGRRTT